jgi:flagellar biosynthesis protein FlhB
MAEAKIHPPSPSRIAEARAEGFAPNPLLVGLSASIFALASCVHLFARDMANDLAALLRTPLDAFAHGESASALARVTPLLAHLVQSLALSALIVAGCVVLGTVLVQGLTFVLPRNSARRFTVAKPSLTASLLALVALSAWALWQLVPALWLELGRWPEFAASLLYRLAAVFFALAIVDASFARAQFFRSLFLSRRELRDAQREAHGAPELRAARAMARRHVHGDP